MASTYPLFRPAPGLCSTNTSCLLPLCRLWIPAHVINFAFVPNRQVGWLGLHAAVLGSGLCEVPHARLLSQRATQGASALLWWAKGPVQRAAWWPRSHEVLPAFLVRCPQRILYANVISIAGEDAVWGSTVMHQLASQSMQDAWPLPLLNSAGVPPETPLHLHIRMPFGIPA